MKEISYFALLPQVVDSMAKEAEDYANQGKILRFLLHNDFHAPKEPKMRKNGHS